MPINNYSWSANELITAEKLNYLSSDANNSTDDIHPQYSKYADIDYSGIDLIVESPASTSDIYTNITYRDAAKTYWFPDSIKNIDAYNGRIIYERIPIVKFANRTKLRVSGSWNINDTISTGEMYLYYGSSPRQIFYAAANQGVSTFHSFQIDIDISSYANQPISFFITGYINSTQGAGRYALTVRDLKIEQIA